MNFNNKNTKADEIIATMAREERPANEIKVNEPSKELLEKLRKKDVPVLASPIAHG